MRSHFFVTLAVLSILSCTDTLGPGVIRDPRELQWSVTTFDNPYVWLAATDIWGTSHRNLFLTLETGGSYGCKLYHFDGSTWSDISPHGILGGAMSYDFQNVWGPSQNEIYVVGSRQYYVPDGPSWRSLIYDSSLALRYSNGVFTEIPVKPKSAFLDGIGQSSDGSIWFSGLNGYFYKLTGSEAQQALLPHPLYPDSGLFHLMSCVVTLPTGSSYLALSHWISYSFSLFKYDASSWTHVKDFPGMAIDLWVSPSGTLYRVKEGLYKYQGGDWTKVLNDTLQAGAITGTSDSNLLVACRGGRIMHFNGRDWRMIPVDVPADAYSVAAWTDGSEYFVAAWSSDTGASYAVRGR